MSAKRMMLGFLGIVGLGFWVVGLIPPAVTAPAAAQTAVGQYDVTPFIPLGKEFWEAMEKLSRDNANTYGDQTQPLLQQIALSSQFVVKTNLTLIKQNERIIHLLEELNRKRLLQEK
ncbi:MAG: hypothetical protein ACOZF2_08535 [Thermodesulfobacteriota bacterium]